MNYRALGGGDFETIPIIDVWERDKGGYLAYSRILKLIGKCGGVGRKIKNKILFCTYQHKD